MNVCPAQPGFCLLCRLNDRFNDMPDLECYSQIAADHQAARKEVILMSLKLKAPQISGFLNYFSDCRSDRECGQNVRNYMKKIRTAVRQFQQGENENVCLYFSAERGSVEDWDSFEERKYWEEEGSDYTYTYEDFIKEWMSEFPEEVIYYEFSFAAYQDAMAFSIGHQCHYETREDVAYDCDYSEIDQFFEWILEQISLCARQMKQGTYEQNIIDKLPFTMKAGTIERAKLWKLDPEHRKWDLDELTQEEIAKFMRYSADNRKLFETGMTSGTFFECCRIGYEANGYDLFIQKENRPMTAKEAYLRYSDGRDNGLSTIDENSPEELVLWKKGDLQEFNGNHPWEVIRGGNSTHVDFGIGHFFDYDSENKTSTTDYRRTYLFIGGYHRQKEVVRMFNALHERGIKVYVCELEDLTERLLGEGKVGIVPNGVFPRYCSEWFPSEHIVSCINLYRDEENADEIAANTEWKEVEYSRLKQESQLIGSR